MSRILQALKQLEARPEAAAESAAAPPASPTPTVLISAIVPAEVDQQAAPSITQPITPRRKRRQARRRATKEAENVALAESALATAAKMEELLATLQPGVIECWEAGESQSNSIVLQSTDCADVSDAEQVIVRDYVPEVIHVERIVERIVEIPSASVIECWQAGDAQSDSVVTQSMSPSVASDAEQVFVREHLPEVVRVERIVEVAAPPTTHAAPVAIEAPVVEAATNEAVAALALQVDLSDPPTAAQTEIELEFQPAAPRRAKREPSKSTRIRRERARAATLDREAQVRIIVRGPRELSLAPLSAWETNIQADLEEAHLAGPLEALTDRWRRERAVDGTSSLFIASLASPVVAAEVTMRAATLLARHDEAAVLVIDADPEAVLSRRIGITGQAGLSELLAPQDAHGETIHPTATARLHVLPRGRTSWPVGASQTDVRKLLDDLSQEYTWLLVAAGDANSAGAQAFARACRGAYVIAPLGKTDVATAQQQVNALRRSGARVLGALTVQ